jgi:2-dehydro-3-deoxygluconokinase
MAFACDILSIGEPLYELTQGSDGRFTPGFGGDTSNAAIAAARLGATVAYVTRIGKDMFGDAFLDLWRREGVSAEHVTRDDDAPTGVYFISHDPDGHHFTYLRKGSAASRMTPADMPEAAIRSARFVHASGVSLAISGTAEAAVRQAFAVAKAAGAAISLDTNFRERLWPAAKARPVIDELAGSASLLKTSIDDGVKLTDATTPETVVAYYRRLGAAAVIVTLGAAGVHAVTPEGEHRIAPLKVAAVDATGAGDAFTGALLAERIRGASWEDALRFANAAAALSTTGFGAVAPLPRRVDVEALLSRA